MSNPTAEKEVMHTPGPWRADLNVCRVYADIPNRGHPDTLIAEVHSGTTLDEAQENARLIASAPELKKRIALLEGLLERYVQLWPAFRSKLIGSPGGAARDRQDAERGLENEARRALCERCGGTGLVTISYGGDGYGDRCAAIADADDQPCPECAA